MLNPKMLRQMQQMQKKMSQMQEELADARVEATAGGGAVKATANGKQEIIEIKIDESVDCDDTEMLQEMILAAVREALHKSQELAQSRMSEITGGMNLPGLM